MNLQCVPGWDLDDPAAAPSAAGLNPGSAAGGTHRGPGPTGTGGAFAPVVVPMADQYYEVAELTWEKGSISSHGLLNRPAPKYPPAAPPQLHATGSGAGAGTGGGGDRETLEAVVGEAAARSGQFARPIPDAPWFGIGVVSVGAVATAGAPADALVPCARDEAAADGDEAAARRNKGARVVVGENGLTCASQGSAAPGRRGESTLLTIEASATAADDVCGFTTTTNNSTSLEREDDKGSPETENTSIGGGASDSRYFSRLSQRDGLCDEEDNMVINGEAGMRSSVSTKRSRAAAIHNESERKRRDRINQKMKTLQKLVPNSSKTDKASMLDEVIDYLKQLQAQVQVISRMSSMMMPMGMAMPQLQMSVMAQMAHMAQMAQMAQGMMNMGSLAQPGYPGLAPPMMHPPPFVPTMSSWDAAAAAAASSTTAAAAGASAGANRAQQPAAGSAVPDAFSAFIASQAQQNGQQQQPQQPSTVEAYNRMVAMYQKMNQQQQQSQPRPSNHKQ